MGAWGPRVCAVVVALGIATSVLFVRRTRSVESPAIDLSLFQSAAFSRATLAALFFGVSFTAMFLGFVFFLEDVWRYGPLDAGLAITPGPLVVVPTAAVAGRIAARRGHRGVLLLGSVLYGAGGLALALALPSSPACVAGWRPTAVLTGLGVGLVLPSLQAAALHDIGSGALGTASAVHQATRQLGSILGVALAIALVESLDADGFPLLFGVMPLAAAAVAVLSLGIDTRPTSRRLPTHDVPAAAAPTAR
jgi:MFS family permease